MKDVDNLKRKINTVRNSLAELKISGFSYDEQELIRRVFKSVINQFTSSSDKRIGKDILNKTSWVDGE